MLGDINIGEPGALIGFAGPRVVKDTTGKDLPEGFQTSEFLLEHGFLDFITHRKELKDKVNLYIDLILNQTVR
jgi:acetyl-CoA carboxylase carboxyl transferase subunit beta